MSVSDDRWTCPACRLTVITNPRWQRRHRAAVIRNARDAHQCGGVQVLR